MLILQVQDLQSGYGKSQVLWKVSLSLKKEEIVTIIGSNGAGKTTLASTIMGLVKPWSGKIIWQGENIAGKKTEEIVKAGIGLAAQGGKSFGGGCPSRIISYWALIAKRTGTKLSGNWMKCIQYFRNLPNARSKRPAALVVGKGRSFV